MAGVSKNGPTRERRKHKRYLVPEDTYAFIMHTPFVIRNISKGGLCLQSVIFDHAPPVETSLDIFCKQDNFYLQDIPVRLVALHKDLNKNTFTTLQIKYFGFQFGELTGQQETRLDYFISHHTCGES
jgi:hypothetical protein